MEGASLVSLEKHFEHQERATYIARKFLKEILDQCEKKDIDIEGLLKEISAEGIHESYIEGIEERDGETYQELSFEKMALIGRKRIQLQNGLDKEAKDLPRKYVESRLLRPKTEV